MNSVSTERLDDLLVKTSRTFAISIPELPEPTRREVTIAYLLFRIADTLEDATAWPAVRKLDALRRFEALLREPTPESAQHLAAAWVADPPLDHAGYLELLGEMPAVLAAYRELDPAARDLIASHTSRTVERMIEFVGRPGDGARLELSDVKDLKAYCYAVAGIVGEMLTELFLLRWAELEPVAAELRLRAGQFGEALQLVNILKDSAGDELEGRSYLAGVERGDILAMARADLLDAGRYVMALQKAGAPVGLIAFTSLPVLLARETLDRVEADGPGAKLTRLEVREIIAKLERAIRHGDPPVM